MTTHQSDTHQYNFELPLVSLDEIEIVQPEDTVIKSFYKKNSYDLRVNNVIYSGAFTEAKKIHESKPFIIMCIKDSSDLLKFTFDNLRSNKVFENYNVLLVDDRPADQTNQKISEKYGCSYLCIYNSADHFNFSMLNNIAVHVIKERKYKIDQFILWSSDLWISDDKVLPSLCSRHIKEGNTISGTKLLYPTEKHYKCRADRKNTIQFGGTMFGPRPGEAGLFPLHLYRGYPADDPKVNCDKGELFITGAFLIIDKMWFIKTGGFAPSLVASFQDVDLCLRANEQNKRVMYYGRDCHLYHYENFSLDQANEDLIKRQISDKIWYKGFWQPERVKNLLYIHER